MKKAIIAVLAVTILILSLTYVMATVDKPARDHDIYVTLINQEPDPANPGRLVDVRFKIDNNGSGSADDMDVEIIPEYPFSLQPGKSATKNIGTLQARQRGDVGVIVKYRLLVDKNAVEGDNDLRVRYRINKEAWIKPEEFKINIRTLDAVLSIDSVDIDTKTLKPGETSKLTIKVSNKADSILRDVKTNLGVSSVPIVPIGSSNEKITYQIGSKESYNFNFDILTDPEAASGAYKLPLRISYSDTAGNPYAINGTIGLVIGTIPDLSITLDDSTIYEPGKAGKISIKVVNKGVTDVKFVNLKLPENENYRIISNNEVYLGNIDSDDFETASYDLFVEKTKEGKAILPFLIEYKDANNNDFRKTINIELDLYSASEAKKFGLKEGNGVIGYLIIIVIVIAGLFFYKRYKKKKKKA